MIQFKTLLILAVMLLAAGCNGGSSTKEKSDETQATETIADEAVAKDAAATNAAGLPTVLDFSATWCPPCKMIAPAVHELAEKSEGTVNFEFIDIDQNPAMASKYGVEAVPTFVILDADGKEVNRIVGADINGLTDAVNAVSK